MSEWVKRRLLAALVVIGSGLVGVAVLHLDPGVSAATPWTLVGWNDLGMHCMDADYSVFSILPPYNTIHAQLIDSNGRLVKNAGVQVTYEAVADPSGSINTTSEGKTNFWTFARSLFGAGLGMDTGLKGLRMPGSANNAQAMTFDSAYNWFSAEGIPITAYDDTWNRNAYPMMRLVARDSSGAIVGTTRIVLPVSDEMDCRACHASGSNSPARPAAGWTFDGNPDRDYKLNILRKHDERNGGKALYAGALRAAGYSESGLSATVAGGKPVLCAQCHASNALSAAGVSGVPALTAAIHSFHSTAPDPVVGGILESSSNRSACYRCHPGAETRCLRGPMGNTVAADGSPVIQCQSCHGSMSQVGDSSRQGWLDEPNCQSCHQGNAVSTNGQIRVSSALDASGQLRSPADNTFATASNQPAAGLSLYRFSTGHGGLLCVACHGSTHAEFPSSHDSENLQSIDLTGVAGPIRECTVCHRNGISTTAGGPHGMHPTGAAWVSAHERAASSACRACHGTDYRGSVLARAFQSRTLRGRSGNIAMWPGFIVSCYTCHNGPKGEGSAPAAPTVAAATASVESGQTVTIPVRITGTGTLRVVDAPHGGTVRVSGSSILYQAFPDFEGTDQVTYAALNAGRDSNLGMATVTVTAPARPLFSAASVSNAASYAAGSVAPGMLITVFGSGLGPANLATMRLNSGGFVQKSLETTRVRFNGTTAPLVYSSAGQLAAIVPYSLAGQAAANMVIEYQGIASAPVSIPVIGTTPGIFTADASGTGQAQAANQDGTFNTSANPAARGTVVTFYVTGEGTTTPAVPDGLVSVPPLQKPERSAVVRIGGELAQLQYIGAAPGMVAGVIQVNAVVPSGIAPGNAVVAITIDNTPSQPGVTIAVK